MKKLILAFQIWKLLRGKKSFTLIVEDGPKVHIIRQHVDPKNIQRMNVGGSQVVCNLN